MGAGTSELLFKWKWKFITGRQCQEHSCFTRPSQWLAV